MDEKLVTGRGRPKKDEPRTRQVTIRLTEEEFRDVMMYVGPYGKTYSDVLRNAFKFFTSFLRVEN